MIILKEESFQIMGACFEVYKEMGAGFTEPIYHQSLILELQSRNIPFASQPQLPVFFKGQKLDKKLIPDFVVFDQVILEIKSVRQLADEHRAQTLNYLKATSKPLGLLVNFSGYPKLEYERFANTT